MSRDCFKILPFAVMQRELQKCAARKRKL